MSFQNRNLEQKPELRIVSPLSKAESLELVDADAARVEIDGRLARHRDRHCTRSPICRKFTLAIRRKNDPTQSLHTKADCGRFDCPACLRQWTMRQLNRAVDCLASAEPGSRAPRLGKLYAWTGPAERWEAVSKSIRRRSPACGRLRIIRDDGSCLVIAETAFPESAPVSVLTAVSLAADAIESALHEMHSVRWLGRWAVRQDAADWEIIRHAKPLSEVKAIAEDLGGSVQVKMGRLVVRFGENVNPDDVARFWLLLSVGRCPSPAFREAEELRRIELDTAIPDYLSSFPDSSSPPGETYYRRSA